MIFALIQLSLAYAATLETVYDPECVSSRCPTELGICNKEIGPQDPLKVRHSYCHTVLMCVSEAQGDGVENPAACLDGIDRPMMSAAETDLNKCVQVNKCVTERPSARQSKIDLSVHKVDATCMSKMCKSQLTGCDKDPVCKALFECFDLHSADANAADCTKHLSKLDVMQQSVYDCGMSNKCFGGEKVVAASQVESAATQIPPALNTVAPAPVETKASFVQIKPLSFLSLSSASESELKAAELAAEKQEKQAEVAWEQSRKTTDSLLAKVHEEMDALNKDLDKTSSQEKSDLALLEQNRKKEDAELEATEKKLKDLENTKINLPPVSSFLDENFLAPLKKAAEEAHNFAKRVLSQAGISRGSSSFLQDNSYSERATKSLSLAQQALQKLDADLATEKKELQEEETKAQKDKEAADAAAAAASVTEAASFLQMKYDPLSPQALADWRDRFELQLQKARQAAGIRTPMHSSLLQVPLTPSFEESSQLSKDRQEVERLQAQYDKQMEKLKEDNAELLAEARSEVEKAKDMESKLETEKRESSLLQVGHRYDPVKEEEHIHELERRWERQAQDIVKMPQIRQQDSDLQALIEQQKAKEATAEAQLDQMKAKLNKDIEIMNKDIAMNSLASKSSFLKMREKPAVKADDVVVTTDEKENVKVPSFVQTDSRTKDPAQMALDRAEADLQKLKQQLREETAKLNSMHFGA